MTVKVVQEAYWYCLTNRAKSVTSPLIPENVGKPLAPHLKYIRSIGTL